MCSYNFIARPYQDCFSLKLLHFPSIFSILHYILSTILSVELFVSFSENYIRYIHVKFGQLFIGNQILKRHIVTNGTIYNFPCSLFTVLIKLNLSVIINRILFSCKRIFVTNAW